MDKSLPRRLVHSKTKTHATLGKKYPQYQFVCPLFRVPSPFSIKDVHDSFWYQVTCYYHAHLLLETMCKFCSPLLIT